MHTLRTGRLVASLLVALIASYHTAPTLAYGGDGHDDDRDHPAIVTFTKWITAVVPAVPADAIPGRFLMAGVTDGDVSGTFRGELIDRKVSTSGTITAQIVALDALYEVVAGDRSFTALIQGGQNNATHKALLDGVILGGWRTGDAVHVAFTVIATCAGKPAGPCFQGTITIGGKSEH